MDPATDWVPGPDGYCLAFDGSNDYVLLPSATRVFHSATPSLTIAVWFSGTSALNSYPKLIHIPRNNTWGAYAGIAIRINQVAYFAPSGTGVDLSCVIAHTTNDWTMAALTYTHNVGGFGYYNGVSVGASGGATSISIYNAIMAIACNDYVYTDVTIAAEMLWERALTAGEVARLYADPYAMFRERRRWWMFGQTAGGISVPWHLLQGRAA